MLEGTNPLRFGAILAAVLIGVFSLRFFITSIVYYKMYYYGNFTETPEKDYARMERDNDFDDVRRFSLNLAQDVDYTYPYNEDFNFTYEDRTLKPTFGSEDQDYRFFIKQNLYLNSFYWGLGCLSLPFLIFGVFGESDVCLLVWLHIIALKISTFFKMLISLSLYLEDHKVELIWPYADLPFVIFLMYLWLIVFFYFLEVQRSFFMSNLQSPEPTSPPPTDLTRMKPD